MFTGADDVTLDGKPGSSAIGGMGGTDIDPVFVLADGVVISGVEVYQGVRRPLMENGAPATSTVPLVSGRDTLFRIYYETEAAFAGGVVTARIMIGGETFEKNASLSGPSNIDAMRSTVNFLVPGEEIEGSAFSVSFLQTDNVSSGENIRAQYQTSLPLQSTGDALELVLVPIDFQGQLPDTSDEQIELYRKRFYGLFPARKINITVHPPYTWTSNLDPNGGGWGQLLDELAIYREQQGADSKEHYYGIFQIGSNLGDFCSGGCVLGLSNLAQSPMDDLGRVGMGIGFSGWPSTETAAHEVGHQHGLNHAPCGGAANVDPSFPNADGSIGEYGLDVTDSTLISPDVSDFMTYCDPVHVSPYNYLKMFDRLKAVNAQLDVRGMPTTYDRIRIDTDGTLHWSKPRTTTVPPSGQPHELTLTTDAGEETVTGYFYPYSHLDGGTLLIPQRAQLTQVSIPYTLFTYGPASDRILKR